ncbi:hypothetical protein DF947_12220 [Pedobacter paludis]|uniref:Uncharacterized protein n=1 Tax=Pedobacter paludis TaxID=2203212 RepID=A0A317EY75_9SPHI|nr:hypothetical protein DF947_12220 [Pedobacter paludis]
MARLLLCIPLPRRGKSRLWFEPIYLNRKLYPLLRRRMSATKAKTLIESGKSTEADYYQHPTQTPKDVLAGKNH